MRTAKTLSVSLRAQVILLVLSCCSSYCSYEDNNTFFTASRKFLWAYLNIPLCSAYQFCILSSHWSLVNLCWLNTLKYIQIVAFYSNISSEFYVGWGGVCVGGRGGCILISHWPLVNLCWMNTLKYIQVVAFYFKISSEFYVGWGGVCVEGRGGCILSSHWPLVNLCWLNTLKYIQVVAFYSKISSEFYMGWGGEVWGGEGGRGGCILISHWPLINLCWLNTLKYIQVVAFYSKISSEFYMGWDGEVCVGGGRGQGRLYSFLPQAFGQLVLIEYSEIVIGSWLLF